jgi:hypothetical protein
MALTGSVMIDGELLPRRGAFESSELSGYIDDAASERVSPRQRERAQDRRSQPVEITESRIRDSHEPSWNFISIFGAPPFISAGDSDRVRRCDPDAHYFTETSRLSSKK